MQKIFDLVWGLIAAAFMSFFPMGVIIALMVICEPLSPGWFKVFQVVSTIAFFGGFVYFFGFVREIVEDLFND
jgi:hypothetical protein